MLKKKRNNCQLADYIALGEVPDKPRSKLIIYEYETETVLLLGVSLALLVRGLILEAAFAL